MRRKMYIIFVILGIIFGIFRIIVCLNYSMEKEFPYKPMNFKIELVLLFLTVPCFIGILNRKILASFVYFGLYVSYFGTMLYNQIILPNPQVDIIQKLTESNSIAISFGILIPILVFIDQLIEINGSNFEDGKTTWYYKDEKYTRNIDSRADRNHYKIK